MLTFSVHKAENGLEKRERREEEERKGRSQTKEMKKRWRKYLPQYKGRCINTIKSKLAGSFVPAGDAHQGHVARTELQRCRPADSVQTDHTISEVLAFNRK